MNIDHRLDLYNSLGEFTKKITEDDAIVIVSYNSKSGDTILGIGGDVDSLIGILCSEAEPKNQYDLESYNNVRKWVLSTAINIVLQDEKMYNIFMNALNSTKK